MLSARSDSALLSCHGRGGRVFLLVVAILGTASCSNDDDVTEPTNPVPVLDSLSPTYAAYGDAAFTLILTGSGFISGSVVKWDGAERATSRVSDSLLHAAILESDLAAPQEPADRVVQVWVTNPAPGGGTSNTLPFQLLTLRPIPEITSLWPSAFGIGDPDTALRVEGHGFDADARVRWNGEDLVTEFQSSAVLRAEVAASRLTASAEVTITVFNPPPGGGESDPHALAIAVPNPTPVLTALEPDHITIGQSPGDVSLMLTGAEFLPDSRVRWNGVERGTTYVNDSTLVTLLYAGEVQAAGVFAVSVLNPSPGGGVSNALDFAINNPVPILTGASPEAFLSGQAGTDLYLEGEGFVAGSIVRWNGEDRSTTFDWTGRLKAAVTASDLATAGTAQVSVYNPPPGGGTSAELDVPIYLYIAIAANDIVYDAAADLIYASVGSDGGEQANAIAAIDPQVGDIVSTVYVGSEPTKLARSDDGQYLYVALEGSAKVRRYRIADATPDLEFALGTSWAGPLYAEDIAVLPGSPGTIVVSTKDPDSSPRHRGVFVYDDGIRRSVGTQEHTGSNRIEATEDPTVLFGYNNETTEYGLRRLLVDGDGVHEDEIRVGVISGGADILYTDGKIISSHGTVVNSQTLDLLGQLSVGWSGLAVCAVNDRVFILTEQAIEVFDLHDYAPVGSIPSLTEWESPRYLVQVGEDALALPVGDEGIAILHHPLVAGEARRHERH